MKWKKKKQVGLVVVVLSCSAREGGRGKQKGRGGEGGERRGTHSVLKGQQIVPPQSISSSLLLPLCILLSCRWK